MNKKRMLTVVAAIMCVVFASTLFAGFTTSKKAAADQSLSFNLGSEPKSIDVSLCNAVDGSNVIYAAFEGLTKAGPGNKLEPGVAKSWDISKDGKTYTFHLRSDAKWSDGKQVTAKDFYFSWVRLLDPKTAADYSYQMFYVKNAEKFYNGKAKESDLGLKVVDPMTFQVTLEAPTPYFLLLCSWANFSPLREDIVSANPTTWANSADHYVGNGPFKLTSWKHKDSMEFVKNPYYWNAKAVKLNKLTFLEVTDNTAYLEAWEKGQIDVIQAPPTTEIPRLISDKKIQIDPYYGTYYMEFNLKRYPMNNVKFRQALSLAIDRTGIATAILKAGQKPATAFAPYGAFEPNGKDFRTVGGNYDVAPVTPNIEKAKQLLKESKVDLSKLNITYLYNSESAAHKKIAEYLQQSWKAIGVNVKLANQEWAVFQTSRTSGNYDIARAGWIGDYMDPMTFFDLLTKASGNNDPKYYNPRYEGLIAAAKHEVNPTKRMAYLHQAEDQLMSDLPIAPIYFYVLTSDIATKAKGVYTLATGGIYFDRAYMQ